MILPYVHIVLRKSRILYPMMLIAIIIFHCPFLLASPYLAWDPNTDIVEGYMVYYGISSSDLSNSVNVGNATRLDLDRLPLTENIEYFFSVSAYNAAGESDLSAPVSYTNTDTQPLFISALADAQIYKVKFTGTIGYTILDNDNLEKVKVSLGEDNLWARLCETGPSECGGSNYDVQLIIETKKNGTAVYSRPASGGGAISTCIGEAVFEANLNLTIPGATSGEFDAVEFNSNGLVKMGEDNLISHFSTKGCTWSGALAEGFTDVIGRKCKFKFIREEMPAPNLVDVFLDEFGLCASGAM